MNKGTQPPETAAAPEVNNEAKQKPPKPDKPKKELTPAEMQKRKKMLIMPLFFLVFGAVLWLIFAPSGKDKEKEAQQAGLNVELPMPTDGGLVSDKRDAYEREAMQQKQQDRMRSLQDFSYQLSQAEEKAKAEVPQSVDYYEAPSHTTDRQRTSAIQSSAVATRRSTNSWARGMSSRKRMNNRKRRWNPACRNWSANWWKPNSVRPPKMNRRQCWKNPTKWRRDICRKPYRKQTERQRAKLPLRRGNPVKRQSNP